MGLPASDGTSIWFLNVVPSVIFKRAGKILQFLTSLEILFTLKRGERGRERGSEKEGGRERVLKYNMKPKTFLRVRFSSRDGIFCSSHWDSSLHPELPVILDVH